MAMAYVDVNPVRAGLAERIEACRETSTTERLRENMIASAMIIRVLDLCLDAVEK